MVAPHGRGRGAMHMQYNLNERLLAMLAVLSADRPIAFTDCGDLTGPGDTITVRSGPPAPPPPGASVRPKIHGLGPNASHSLKQSCIYTLIIISVA